MGIKKIAIVGHGLHGSSIATTTALTEDRKVTVIDNQPEPKVYRITNPYPKEVQLGKPFTFIRKNKKVYPNEPCTCGSGNKFKKCCR